MKPSGTRIAICRIPVDVLTMNETLIKIDQAIQFKKPVHHVVINAAKVVNAQNNQDLKQSIVDCDIINADGQSVVWASRILGKPLPERVAGIDLMINLIQMASEKGYKIFLLGATEEVLQKVVNVYKNKYGEKIIAGYRNGYFTKEEEGAVAKQIARSGADMLFVAMTSPQKEIFLNKYKTIINAPFIMGVGGSFDVIAGKTRRAPLWMQRTGLEWLFRVCLEPKRMWKRYLYGNSKFVYLVFKEKFRQFSKLHKN